MRAFRFLELLLDVLKGNDMNSVYISFIYYC